MYTGVHYSADELIEFESLIIGKLGQAEAIFRGAVDSLLHLTSNSTDDTYAGNPALEDCGVLQERQELTRVAHRQEKFIGQLKGALFRIKQGDHGVCRATGHLIPKERLRLVPHATLSVEAKTRRL